MVNLKRAPLAQWIERVASDHKVEGSNPSGREKTWTTKFSKKLKKLWKNFPKLTLTRIWWAGA